MSKKNLFETGLRLLGIYLLLQVPLASLRIGMAFAHDVSEYFNHVLLYRSVVILSPLFLILMSSVLLFKASSIATFFISDNNPVKQEPAPSGSIYTLSFWIILIGLFYLISSITKIISELMQFSVTFPAWLAWGSIFSQALMLFFAVAFIFRSNKIAGLIQRLSK